jgi:hypothetical protein
VRHRGMTPMKAGRPPSDHSVGSLRQDGTGWLIDDCSNGTREALCHSFASTTSRCRLDGFGTGEGQSLETPFGHASHRLHEWFFPTRAFREQQGQTDGSRGIDDAFASQWGAGIGVEIMGRNKFGYQRGPWENDEWTGWWGDNPPFHTPVVVLTHHVRPMTDAEPRRPAAVTTGTIARPRRAVPVLPNMTSVVAS